MVTSKKTKKKTCKRTTEKVVKRVSPTSKKKKVAKKVTKPRRSVQKSTKHPGGRPHKWPNADKMAAAIDEYFKRCEEREKRPTTSGLALALGYASRQSLWDNKSRDEVFSYVIKRALLQIQNYYEELLPDKPAGCIFQLMNMQDGWKNEHKHELSGEINIPGVVLMLDDGKDD